MATTARPYAGYKDGKYHYFRSATTPTSSSHGSKYDFVTGPFRTAGAAQLFCKYAGHGNPHFSGVWDAERLYKQGMR